MTLLDSYFIFFSERWNELEGWGRILWIITSQQAMECLYHKGLQKVLLNACNDGRIDSHFGDSYIGRLVLLVFIKQMFMKHLTNSTIILFCLTITLRMVSRYSYSMWSKQFTQGFLKVSGSSRVSFIYNRGWDAKILYHILKKK